MRLRAGYLMLGAAFLLGAAYAAVAWWDAGRDRLPEGIVVGNGRIEATQIDVAATRSGRIVRVAVREGDMVEAGQILAQLDVEELEAELDRAEAEVALAKETTGEARALIAQRESELRLADHDLGRAASLVDKGHASMVTLETRQSARDVARAALAAAEAQVATAGRRVAAAEAEVRRIVSRIGDSTLEAPAAGRVLYRLAEAGEIVAAGRPVLTLLDLGDVYMEVFLAAGDAARTPLGAEARIVLDVLPDYAIPAAVSFVAPEAQFTPRQVETLEEREKLVFRVRVRIPPDLVAARIAHVKTGVRGVAYVKLDPGAVWPERLDRRIPPEMFE